MECENPNLGTRSQPIFLLQELIMHCLEQRKESGNRIKLLNILRGLFMKEN